MKSSKKKDFKIREYALSMFLQVNPDNPNEQKYTYEKIVESIEKKFHRKISKHTIGTWVKRYNWREELEKIKIDYLSQLDQKELEKQNKENNEEFLNNLETAKENAKNDFTIYCNKVQSSFDKAVKVLDNLLSSQNPDKDSIDKAWKVGKVIESLNNVLTKTKELDYKYIDVNQINQDQIINITMDNTIISDKEE